MTPVHVHRHHPRRHVCPARQLAELRDDTSGRARPDPVPPVDQLVAADHHRLAQAVGAHVLDQLVELAAGHDREHGRRRMDPVLTAGDLHQLVLRLVL